MLFKKKQDKEPKNYYLIQQEKTVSKNIKGLMVGYTAYNNISKIEVRNVIFIPYDFLGIEEITLYLQTYVDYEWQPNQWVIKELWKVKNYTLSYEIPYREFIARMNIKEEAIEDPKNYIYNTE